MNQIPLSFITELLYPPLGMSSQVLKDLFMQTSNSYGFTHFQLLSGEQGARMRTDQKRECAILRDKMVYKDEMTEQPFDSYRTQLLTLARHVRDALRIPVFITQSVVLRYLFPTPGGKRADLFIRDEIAGIGQDSLNLFGRPSPSAALRLIFPATQEARSEFSLRLEPYFRDMSMVFAENTARFFVPVQKHEQIEANLDAAHEFLCVRLPEFLNRETQGNPGE